MRGVPCVLAIGLTLSAYAFYVEMKFEEARRLGLEYKALCDIGVFSCTKVFSSELGYVSQFLGLPKISNAAVGFFFYLVMILIERNTRLLLVCSAGSCVGSVVLFYLLTVHLRDFCIVCFSIYVVNFTTFFIALRRARHRADHADRLNKVK